MEKSIAVGLILPDLSKTVAEEHLEELAKLVEAAGGSVAAKVLARRNAPDPATWVGRGKAEELRDLALRNEATLIVFDDELSPAQVRNLDKVMDGKAKVIDRSALILEIFAGRARTREAKTQVELARLEYSLPRLTRAWSHLERQAGGAGGGAKRGVGETQLELDRRIVRTRIARLKEELKRIERQRETQRKSRRAAYSVALVGYTNAGKSTLFNRLTRGDAFAMDQLFATLDARTQKIAASMPIETVVIDTVGFIRKLPHHLVASFRSTMEEAVAADLVLHVIDGSHPQFDDQRKVGEEVLASLGVDPSNVIEVYNKSDLMDDRFPLQRRKAVTVSATTGEHIDLLLEVIRDRERERGELLSLTIPAAESRLLARLHELAEVQDEQAVNGVVRLRAWVPHEAEHLFEGYKTRS
jgi:GTP-binding protein HflX